MFFFSRYTNCFNYAFVSQENVLVMSIDIVHPKREPRDLLVVDEAFPAGAIGGGRGLFPSPNVDSHILRPEMRKGKMGKMGKGDKVG